MLDKEGAGAGEEDLDGQSGSGAPEGGSPEGGSEKDQKDEFVPAKQLKAALANQRARYEERIAGLQAQFDAFKAGGGGGKKEDLVEAPKRYTRAELKAAVTAHQITEEQSDEIWAKQVTDQAKEAAIQAADEHVTRKTAKERVDSDLAKYKRLAPEILDAGSEVRKKIVAEFQDLRDTGMPNNLTTELAAIRAVMGPLDKLETARSARRQVEHDEQSGGGGEGRKGNSGKSLWDQLDPRKKDYYEKGIKAGRYKDKAAVEAELKFARR